MSSLIVLQNVRTIQLTKGKNALIDEADAERVLSLAWHANPMPKSNQSSDTWLWYAFHTYPRGSKPRILSLHRFLMDVSGSSKKVDHANRDGLDNRRENLRLSTQSENNCNSRKRNGCSSRYKGVCYCNQKNKWLSAINVASKKIHLGFFSREQDAASAYDRAATKYFGEFARTNADLGLL